jgi:hypothetical protein
MKSLQIFIAKLLTLTQLSIQTIDLKRHEFLIKEGQVEYHI